MLNIDKRYFFLCLLSVNTQDMIQNRRLDLPGHPLHNSLDSYLKATKNNVLKIDLLLVPVTRIVSLTFENKCSFSRY